MVAEVEKTVEEAVAAAEQAPTKARRTTKKAAAAVTEVQAAAEQTAGNGKGTVVGQVKGVVKEVAERVESNPVTGRVVKAAREMQEDIEKSPVTARVRRTVQDTAESVQKSQLVALAHRVLLAGIGAAALAQEEIEDFINRLVERGEIAEADGRKMLKDVLEKRRKMIAEVPAVEPRKIAGDLEKRVEDVLARMNIPTKDEIEALGAKITALTRKVDELKKGA